MPWTDPSRVSLSSQTASGFSNRESIFQKKLADYFRLLVSQGEMLAEFYETAALMRSDEANLISALLTSLNVVDCNLCVKVRKNNQTKRERGKYLEVYLLIE